MKSSVQQLDAAGTCAGLWDGCRVLVSVVKPVRQAEPSHSLINLSHAVAPRVVASEHLVAWGETARRKQFEEE